MLHHINAQNSFWLFSMLLYVVIEVVRGLCRVCWWQPWRLDIGSCLMRSTWHLRRRWSVWVVCWRVPVDQ